MELKGITTNNGDLVLRLFGKLRASIQKLLPGVMYAWLVCGMMF
jgi:hypothetical protein